MILRPFVQGSSMSSPRRVVEGRGKGGGEHPRCRDYSHPLAWKPRVSAQPRGNDSAYGEELGRAEPTV